MSKIAIRLLALATYTTALVVVPMVTPAKAATINSKHIKKHKKKIQKSPGFGDPWSAVQAWPVTGLPVRQAGSAQATPEASSVGRGLLQCMMILIEKSQALTAVKRT